MPLSEDDQRIFSEIERSFYESDPEFVRRLAGRQPKPTESTGRNIKLGAAGFVLGLVVLVAGFTVHVLVGFLGFALMVGSGLLFVDNARRAGRSRMQELSDKVGQAQSAARDRTLRDRRGRDDA